MDTGRALEDMTPEEFAEWATSGAVQFPNVKDFPGTLYFHPDRAKELAPIFEKITSLNFILVDEDGFPTEQCPEGSLRTLAGDILMSRNTANECSAIHEAWTTGKIDIVEKDGQFLVCSTDAEGQCMILAAERTKLAAEAAVRNNRSNAKNAQYDRFYGDDFTDKLDALGLTPELIKRWAYCPQASEGEHSLLDIMDIDELMDLYDGRIPVRIGEVVIFDDGVAMVAIEWDAASRNVVWMQDWAAGDKVWMRNVANGYDTKKWKAWKSNYNKNKKFINRGISALKGSHKGKPMIIMGNGPGLMRNIKNIRPHKDLKIAGCNRALNYMDSHNEYGKNIVDYYMYADYEGRPDWYKGLKDYGGDVLAYIMADSGIADHADPNGFYWFVLSNYIEECQEEMDLRWLDWLCSGTSVSTPLMHFAYYVLEADPIILVGFDHAYTGQMKYPGVPLTHTVLGQRHPTKTFKLERDVYGGPTITDNMLYLQKMQNDALPFFHMMGDRRFVNASEAGILNSGLWETTTLEEAYKWFIDKTEEPPSKWELTGTDQAPVWWHVAKEKLLDESGGKVHGSALLH